MHGESGPVGVDHYENFPVASWLCPPALRPPIAAIYRFARTRRRHRRRRRCQRRRAPRRPRRLSRRPRRRRRGARRLRRAGPSVFGPLADAIARHRLPVPLLADLLDAFAQDAVQTRYADRAELLDYCRRSANPIGRLLLHLYGIADAGGAGAVRRDLQRAAARQLLAGPRRRCRARPPLRAGERRAPARRRGRRTCSIAATARAVRALVGELVAWARELMHSGAPLVHAIPGRAGWELRLVVQGGLRILEQIDRLGGATLLVRPTIGVADAPLLAWRALTMRRRGRPRTAGAPAPRVDPPGRP